MARLSDEDLREIQVFVDRALEELQTRGLTLEIDADLSKWVELMRHVPGSTDIASTHDPRKSYVHPGNAFWIIVREREQSMLRRLLHRERPVVSCVCYRVIETENIAEEIRTQRLFFDRKPILDFRPVEIVKPDNLPVIGGKVGIAGGFWVHPDYRGSKLSNIVSRLTRILSLRHFENDWHVSLVRDTPRRKAMIHNTYGVSHSVSITRGYYPPYGRDYDMQMSYMHRDEMLRRVRQENADAVKDDAVMPTEERRRSAH